MVLCKEIQQKIQKELAESVVVVDNPRGDDVHFKIEITYKGFSEMNKIEQHRKVYEILGNQFGKCGESLHAIELKTKAK